MEESLSGTLAIDLGNTNTVVAFQDQKDNNSVLVEIPNITSSPGVIPSAVWFEESSKIPKMVFKFITSQFLNFSKHLLYPASIIGRFCYFCLIFIKTSNIFIISPSSVRPTHI